MFFDKWSTKVQLPLGPKWGNDVGGIRDCLNWARPPVPPKKQPERPKTSFSNYSRGVRNFASDLRYKDLLPEEKLIPEVRTHAEAGNYLHFQTQRSDTPDGSYYNLEKDHWIYKDLDVKPTGFTSGKDSRPSTAGAKNTTDRSNAEVLVARLNAMKKRNDVERLKRMVEKNSKSPMRKLAFDTKLHGVNPPKSKGYGFMGPPPPKLTPTPPPSRNKTNRPSVRPQSSAGRTETYRYTEREVVIEDMDDGKKTTSRTVTNRPHSHYGRVSYRANTPNYSRPSSTYGAKDLQKYYNITSQEEDSFSPTPLAFQTREFGKSIPREAFHQNKVETPQSPVNPYLSTLNNSNENITIHVDCAKYINTKDKAHRAKSVTVRLHGIPYSEADNIKVLTIPNTAEAQKSY